MGGYLLGKSAIVTGASSGIGKEIAIAFAKNGANVLAVARSKTKLDTLTNDCQSFKGKVVGFQADLQDKIHLKQLVDKAVNSFGSVDILVNNAGIGYERPFSEQSPDQIDSVISTNLMAPMYLTKLILPVLLKNKTGVIMYVTSLAGKIGFPNLAPYSASKFGLEGFAETIREEVKDRGIKVVVVRPGVTDTDFFAKAGMNEFYSEVRKSNKIHPPSRVSDEILSKIESLPDEIVVGTDKFFLRLLPYVPYRQRFRLLDVTNVLN